MIRLKNEKEIDGIRKSCHALADLFREVVPQVEPGMSTKDIDDLVVKFIKQGVEQSLDHPCSTQDVPSGCRDGHVIGVLHQFRIPHDCGKR